MIATKTRNTRTASLKYFISAIGITQTEIAKRMNITNKTLTSKIHEPDRFTVGEMREIIDILELDVDEAAHIFFF